MAGRHPVPVRLVSAHVHVWYPVTEAPAWYDPALIMLEPEPHGFLCICECGAVERR